METSVLPSLQRLGVTKQQQKILLFIPLDQKIPRKRRTSYLYSEKQVLRQEVIMISLMMKQKPLLRNIISLNYKCNEYVKNFLNLVFQNGFLLLIQRPTKVTRTKSTAIDQITTVFRDHHGQNILQFSCEIAQYGKT